MVAGAVSVEGATDLSSCRYVDFPDIGTIDLDTTELPSNDREILKVATKRMFADPSILDAIASVTSALREDEAAGVSAPPHRARGGGGGSQGV
jgi:phosphoenolpyruvate-protein kinase (PTS system EI component)